MVEFKVDVLTTPKTLLFEMLPRALKIDYLVQWRDAAKEDAPHTQTTELYTYYIIDSLYLDFFNEF